MATTAQIRERVKQRLYSAAPHEHPYVTLVNEPLDASETDVTLDTNQGANFSVGDIIEIDTELMLVTAVATDTLTVIRGWDGSTAATHADNAPITKNPRFSAVAIDNAQTAVIDGMEDWGIHGFGTGTLTLVANQTYYDVTAADVIDHLGVLGVYYPKTTSLLPVSLPFKWMSDLHATVSTTGHGLYLWEWGDLVAGNTVYYTYASKHDAVGDLDADQEELLILGAMVILLGGTIAPATHDPGARTDRTVAPGQTSRDVRFYQGQFFLQARAEAAHLAVHREKFARRGGMRHRRAQRWVP